MTARDALGLDGGELTQFLRDEVGSGTEIVVACPGVDGYPEVTLVAGRYLDSPGGDTGMIEFTGAEPVDGVSLCAIIERGATYDDICAVILRGVVSRRRVGTDDVVTFAFAKLTG